MSLICHVCTEYCALRNNQNRPQDALIRVLAAYIQGFVHLYSMRFSICDIKYLDLITILFIESSSTMGTVDPDLQLSWPPEIGSRRLGFCSRCL